MFTRDTFLYDETRSNRLVNEKTMIRVVLESPFSGDVEENIKYAKECIRDCLKRGEAPIGCRYQHRRKEKAND